MQSASAFGSIVSMIGMSVADPSNFDLDELGGIEGLTDPANQDKVDRVGELFSDPGIEAAGESLARYFQNACSVVG